MVTMLVVFLCSCFFIYLFIYLIENGHIRNNIPQFYSFFISCPSDMQACCCFPCNDKELNFLAIMKKPCQHNLFHISFVFHFVFVDCVLFLLCFRPVLFFWFKKRTRTFFKKNKNNNNNCKKHTTGK